MSQFCYLRVYFCIDFFSRRLLQWIEGLKMDWNLGQQQGPNKIQDIQQPDKCTMLFQIMKVMRKVTLKYFLAGNAWLGREDQYEIMTGASGSWGWCHIDGYTT